MIEHRKLLSFVMVTFLMISCSDPKESFEADFGAPYRIVESDNLPKIEGDSLQICLRWEGCGDSADYEFLLDYEMVGEVQNIWLEKMVDESCRAVFETEMSFLLPHAVSGSMRIQLMNPEGNDFALR